MKKINKNHFNNPIVIILFLILIGIGGYFLFAKNSSTPQANTPNPQQAEIDALKKTVEDLKNQKPPIITKQAPTSTTKSTTTIVSEWQNRVAEVKCKFAYSNGTVFETDQGSATLVGLLGANGKYIPTAMTNKHVIMDTSSTFFPSSCTVGVYGYGARGVDFISTGNPFSIGNPDLGKTADLGFISLQNPSVSNDNGAFDKIISSDINFCKESQVKTGDQVVVLGYPAIGTENGITATEGIISGIENDYYVTSAKIDHGNSGGAAILVKNDCWLGIPTWVATGYIESLGRILKGS